MKFKLRCFTLKLISASLCASLLLSSCSSGSDDSDKDNDNTNPDVKFEAAEPSQGIGRKKSGKAPAPEKPKIKDNYVICIDPGHGFVDGGCGEGIWEDGTLEKDITLAISKKLSEDLIELGFSVIMTHDGTEQSIASKDDGNLIFNTYERTGYANSIDIDYFVSIHVNSYDKNPDTAGIRIFYEDDNNWRKVGKESDVIANAITNSINSEMKPLPEATLYDQNVESYHVVRETLVAASLIETGFCTNAQDAKNLVDDEWQSNLAQAIADGIYTYYSDFKG